MDYEAARALYETSLTTCWELGYKRGIAESLEAFARLAAAQAQSERAAHLWSAAEVLREAIGSPMPSGEQKDYDEMVSVAREALGEEPFASAWADGRAITLEQMVEYALS